MLKEKNNNFLKIRTKMHNEHETLPFYANFWGLQEGAVGMRCLQPNPKFSWGWLNFETHTRIKG